MNFDPNKSDHNTKNASESQKFENSTLLSRRSFLYGALGVGALALASTHISSPNLAFADDQDIEYLSVPESSVFTLDDCTEIPFTDALSLMGRFELPYGTLLWASGDNLAACLFPTEHSKPLTQVGILYLSSGNYEIVIETPLGLNEGFDIYDVRANDQGLVWTEANILSGVWRIFSASFENGVLGESLLLDEGDHEWETPTIAVADSFAFWQVLPKTTGKYASENSVLKRAFFGSSENEIVYRSEGRMSSPPYPLKDALVITPRTSTDAIHHQLTLISASSGNVDDSLILPQGMRPTETGYGKTGFSFSFDGIYNYGEGISNLGTYTAQSSHEAYDYEGKTWFRFNKPPAGSPSWCADHFIVKSTRSVCGVDVANKIYYAIDVENGSDSYGDYLGSTGENNTFLTYANVHEKPSDDEEKRYCLVRLWTLNA